MDLALVANVTLLAAIVMLSLRGLEALFHHVGRVVRTWRRRGQTAAAVTLAGGSPVLNTHSPGVFDTRTHA